MTILDDIHRVIDDCERNLNDATEMVMNSTETILQYVVRIGLEAIQSKRRRENRRDIKRELRPQYQRGAVTGSVQFTGATKKRLAAIADRVYGPDGWNIGGTNIGKYTKPMLLAQALAEENSAKGSMVNARLYHAFAEPLPNDEITVEEFWNAKAFLKEKQRVQSESKRLRPDLR